MTQSKYPSDTPLTAVGPTRRGALVGAGALAAVVGAGSGWWWHTTAAAADAKASEPFAGFWGMQWTSPDGAPLRIQDFRGRPLLINFWATWCPPCIEELPLINDFYRKQKALGWGVIGLAVDRVAAVQNFLKKMPLDFPVGMVGMADADLGQKLGNASGSLPFSVALGSQGLVLQRKLGRLRAEDLTAWAQLK